MPGVLRKCCDLASLSCRACVERERLFAFVAGSIFQQSQALHRPSLNGVIIPSKANATPSAQRQKPRTYSQLSINYPLGVAAAWPFHGTLGSLQQYALKRPLPGLNRNTLCFTMQAGGYTYLPRKTSIGAGDNKQLQ